MPAAREEFLLRMYDQLWNNINRHIVIQWEAITALVATAAVFALVEKAIISFYSAAIVAVVATCWVLAHAIDASHWYNRNLLIIRNIERTFLSQQDVRGIHYFFNGPPRASMITFLRIQCAMAALLLALTLVGNTLRIVLSPPPRGIEWALALAPYAIAASCLIYVVLLHKSRAKAFDDLSANSPGPDIRTNP